MRTNIAIEISDLWIEAQTNKLLILSIHKEKEIFVEIAPFGVVKFHQIEKIKNQWLFEAIGICQECDLHHDELIVSLILQKTSQGVLADDQ